MGSEALRRIELTDCTVDLVGRSASFRDGAIVALTEQDVALLAYFALRPGEVVTRADLLADVLGYSSRSRTRAVDHAVTRLRSKLERDTPLLVTVHGVGYRLVAPAPPPSRQGDRFVGRAVERELLSLRLSEARFVALLGPGGIGKSRLATEVLADLAARWPGGVATVSAGSARSTEELAHALAGALQLPLAQRDPIGRLTRALAVRGATLCRIDDAEAAPALVATLVGVLAAASPHVQVLTTSRTRLSIEGEVVIPIGQLSPQDAAALLVARATEADARLELDSDQVARCVAGLDHYPLAIELAAALLRVAPLDAVLGRLGSVLASRPVHRAVLGTVGRLSPDERQAWTRLGRFCGGFSTVAAERVIGAASLPLLGSLVDLGLLSVEGTGRLRMLAPIRAAAREAGADPDASRRHAEWHGRWGEPRAIDALHGPTGRLLRRELALELDDVLAATEWAHDAAAPELVSRCLVGAAEMLGVGGRLGVLEGLLERALRMAGVDRPALLRIEAQRLLGSGDAVAAERALREATEGAGPWESARIRSDLAVLLGRSGRTEEAQGVFELALADARAARARRLEAVILGNHAFYLHELGRLPEAREELSTAVAALERASDHRMLAGFLGNLGLVCRDLGEVERARALFHRSEAEHLEVGDLAMAAIVAANLSALERSTGRLADAERSARRAFEAVRGLGLPRAEGFVLSALAAVHHASGRHAEAVGDYALAVEALNGTGDRVSVARAGLLRARSLAALGHPRARSAFDVALGEVEATDQRPALAIGLAWRAEHCLAAGDLAEARADLDRAVSLLDPFDPPAFHAEVHAWRACLEASVGDRPAALRELVEASARPLATDVDVQRAVATAQRLVDLLPA